MRQGLFIEVVKMGNTADQDKRCQAVDAVLRKMRAQVLDESSVETAQDSVVQNDGAVDGRCDVVGPVGLEPTTKAL